MIGARRITFGDLVPRVRLGLLHAQRDFLLLLVDVQDLHFDRVADLDQFAGWLIRLVQDISRDVDQAFDARLQLDEGAVAHDVDDFAGVPAVDRVLALDVLPTGWASLLQAQGDLLASLSTAMM